MENNKPARLYLSRVDQHYVSHNAFHEKIAAGIKKFDRMVVADPAVFRKELAAWIQDVHQEHKRCKPMFIEDGWSKGRERDVYIRIVSAGNTIVSMNLFAFDVANDGKSLFTEALKRSGVVFEKPAVIASNALFGDDFDVDPFGV